MTYCFGTSVLCGVVKSGVINFILNVYLIRFHDEGLGMYVLTKFGNSFGCSNVPSVKWFDFPTREVHGINSV